MLGYIIYRLNEVFKRDRKIWLNAWQGSRCVHSSGGDLAPSLGGTENFVRGPRFLNDDFFRKISRPKFLMTFFIDLVFQIFLCSL